MAYVLAFVWYMACSYMSILYGLSFTATIQVSLKLSCISVLAFILFLCFLSLPARL